jgi:MATE family multidrug resistance protein
MAAASVVAGQNAGALRHDRSVRGVSLACGLGVAIAAAASVLFLTVPEQLIGVFGMRDPAAVRIGVQLLAYLSVSSVPFAVGLICMGGLQGVGDTRTPLVIALISQILLPVAFCSAAAFVMPLVPATMWQALVLAHATRCALAVAAFRRGRWRLAAPLRLARV